MKKLQIIILTLLIITFSCGNNELTGTISEDVTVKEGEEIIIKGNVTFTNGAVMTLKPGSKMNFKDIENLVHGGEAANISFKDNSYIVAEGTKEKNIEFYSSEDDGGGVYIKESANGDRCSFKYSLLNNDIHCVVEGNIEFYYNKFYYSLIVIDSGNPIIKNNTFKFKHNAIKTYGQENTNPVICYNVFNNISHIENLGNAIIISINDSPLIQYNNILNSYSYAIFNKSTTFVIENNYIFNCNQVNGFSGIDTTGVQSWQVKYDSPLLESVSEAGCGW